MQAGLGCLGCSFLFCALISCQAVTSQPTVAIAELDAVQEENAKLRETLATQRENHTKVPPSPLLMPRCWKSAWPSNRPWRRPPPSLQTCSSVRSRGVRSHTEVIEGRTLQGHLEAVVQERDELQERYAALAEEVCWGFCSDGSFATLGKLAQGALAAISKTASPSATVSMHRLG